MVDCTAPDRSVCLTPEPGEERTPIPLQTQLDLTTQHHIGHHVAVGRFQRRGADVTADDFSCEPKLLLASNG